MRTHLELTKDILFYAGILGVLAIIITIDEIRDGLAEHLR